MKIYGFEKLSMVDFEGHLCATVFTGGCNFRCPFCQNADLVNVTNLEQYSEDEIFAHLEKRKNVLDSVCISGGEPTLNLDLKNFIQKLKQRGLLVKLDTNGTKPDLLKELIDEGLIDYVAMDVKNSPALYPKTAGAIVNMDDVGKSVELLKSNVVPYEFRTTLVSGHHSNESIEEMGKWLDGADKIYLQCFVDSGNCLHQGLQKVPKDRALIFKTILQKYIKQVELRGY